MGSTGDGAMLYRACASGDGCHLRNLCFTRRIWYDHIAFIDQRRHVSVLTLGFESLFSRLFHSSNEGLGVELQKLD
jgi:hypothetical protein